MGGRRKSYQGSRRQSYSESDSGGYLDALPKTKRETQRDPSGVPVIYEAARRGHRQLVMKLIQDGEDVNLLECPEYETPLHLAAATNDEQLIRLLLRAGAHTEARDKEDLTPLHWACEKGSHKAVKILLEAGADHNAIDMNNSTPMHWAAQRGHTIIVKELIKGEAYIDVQDEVLRTPLHWAAQQGYADLCALLLEHKADLSFRDQWGCTALHDAAGGGHARVVDLLIKNGTDVLAQDNDGFIPRDVAIGEGHSEVVDIMDSSQWEFLASNDPRPAAPGQPLAEEGEEKGSVLITWNPPLPTKHPVAGYEVQIRELVDGSKTEWMRFGFTHSLDEISMEKGKLKEGRTYMFRVHSRNTIDNWGPFGQVSAPYMVPLPQLACLPVTIFPHAFIFQWAIPKDSETVVADLGSLLFHVEVHDSEGRLLESTRTSKRFVKVSNLSPTTEYSAKVAMSNLNEVTARQVQWGDWSEFLHIKTLSVGEQPLLPGPLPPTSEMLVIDLGKSEKRLDEKVAMGKRATFNYARELGSQSAWGKWNALPFYFRVSLILLVVAVICFLDSGLFAAICSSTSFSSQKAPEILNAIPNNR